MEMINQNGKHPGILDCTLRDGGYYTNWDFNYHIVETYLNSLNKLPIDWIEIGYRSKPQKEYLGEFNYCPKYVLEKVRSHFDKGIAIMLNEKDVRVGDSEKLLASAQGLIDMVRLAVDPKNILRSIDLANAIKNLGFKVGLNVMYMSNWKKQPGFLECLDLLNEKIDYFYLVDSFGGVYPEDVKEVCRLVRERINIPFGFHGHNNLELALINSITAIENGASLIDATITGMGRGAGNLKTELLLTALNAKEQLELDYNLLSQVVDVFMDLQKQYDWGTSLPYMVSGANSLPQKEVMDWVGKRFYSFNSIIRALENQQRGIEDNDKFKELNLSFEVEKVLIIGGGPSVVEHKQAICQLIEKNEDLVVVHSSSRNAMSFKDISNKQVFCLVGNEGFRMEEVFSGNLPEDALFILPPFPRKMGTYVPEKIRKSTFELGFINFTDKLKDTHTSLALQFALNSFNLEIYLVGYDGYGGLSIGEREIELMNENDFLFKSFKKFSNKKLVSLTKTSYQELESMSIYSLI